MALVRFVDHVERYASPDDLYESLTLPPPLADRPSVFVNMAATADGKVVVGEAGGPSRGVGGPTDQLLFRRLQGCADAVVIGAGTLRASEVTYPAGLPRIVVTSGRGPLPFANRFFTDSPDHAFVATTQRSRIHSSDLPHGVRVLRFGDDEVDVPGLMRWARSEAGASRLLCEGGPSLNDQLMRLGMIDDFFLTIAPRFKGGASLPTPVDGIGLPAWQSAPATLLSVYADGSELYIRYRLRGEHAGSTA